MTRKYQQQGGWIASFVVVGAILVLSVLAGLYYLKTQSTTEQATEQPTSTEEEKPASESAENKSTKSADAEKSEEQNNAPKPVAKPDDESKTDTQQSGEPSTNTPRSNKAEIAANLPATGPEDAVWQLLSLGLLTTATVAYIQSRRHL